jgi:hypothetical protein
MAALEDINIESSGVKSGEKQPSPESEKEENESMAARKRHQSSTEETA